MNKATKNVAKFFIFTFIQTWVCYFAIILLGLNAKEGLGVVFLILGGMAPSFVGFVMAIVTYSKDEKKVFLHDFIK